MQQYGDMKRTYYVKDMASVCGWKHSVREFQEMKTKRWIGLFNKGYSIKY